ncbi:MAG TPA: hypothetical protein VL485_27480 [Ktedonobacteraceae bacterium]|nr:hypothetical protein [Ktedonobacteraceae bacterium]
MDARYLAAKLSKEQCLTFLDSGLAKNIAPKKAQLIESLLERITQDSSEMDRLLAMFPYELAVDPVELATLLSCSRSERQRWVKEERIPVLEYRSFRVAGRDQLFPVFDRRLVLAIPLEEVALWRKTHLAEMKERRLVGAQRAAVNRKSHTQARQHFMQSWLATVQAWQQIAPPELVALLQLCYWTVLASRWAKENQLKALRSRKLSSVYQARKESWYARKNEAMRLLAGTSYAHLSFYRPPDPDKRHLWLCDEHYEEKCEFYHESVWDFFALHAAEVRSCPRCSLDEEQDYYSLYYLEVKPELFPDLHFSFHMPFPVGKAFFPAPETLPNVQHVEQDGLFRFGRSLVDEERTLHRENDVLACFEQALQSAKNCYQVFVHAEVAGR